MKKSILRKRMGKFALADNEAYIRNDLLPFKPSKEEISLWKNRKAGLSEPQS